MKEEFLNEARYQKNEKNLTRVAIILLVVGLVGGLALIVTGGIIAVSGGKKSEYSKEIKSEKKKLEERYQELVDKGVTYDFFTEYTDGEKYELKIIHEVLDPSVNSCVFTEYKNSEYTSNYCDLINKQNMKYNTGMAKSFLGGTVLTLIGIALITTLPMIGGILLLIAKRRHITAFTTQQVLPVAQEGIVKMAPTAGVVAREISKGIVEGKNEADDPQDTQEGSQEDKKDI